MVSLRPSGRVVQPDADNLARGPGSATSGAEAPLVPSPPRRTGRRRLERIRTGLSERDRAVISSLEACHYLTTTQVERLWFRGTGLTPLTAARSSRRTLNRLHSYGLIDHLERRIGGVRAGSASFVWTLTNTGHRLAGQDGRRRHHEPSPRHLDHVLAVAELVVRLHEAARSDELQIVGVETEPICWRPVASAHSGREWLKPDLKVTIAVGEFELHWWVEIDRATEHRPTLRRKAEAYLRAWREGGEQARSGVAPRVLWVAPDEARRHVISEVIDEVAAPDGMFVTSTETAAVSTLRGGMG